MNDLTIDPDSIHNSLMDHRGKCFPGFAFWKKKDHPKRNDKGDSSEKKRRRKSKLKRFWKRVIPKRAEGRTHSIASSDHSLLQAPTPDNSTEPFKREDQILQEVGSTDLQNAVQSIASSNHSLLQAPTQDNSTEPFKREDQILQEIGSTDLQNAVLTPSEKEEMMSCRISPTAVVDWTLERDDANDDFVPKSLKKMFEEVGGMQLEEEKKGMLHPLWTIVRDDDIDDFVPESSGKFFEKSGMQLEGKKEDMLHPGIERQSVASEAQCTRTLASIDACVGLLSDKDIKRNRRGFLYLNALTQPSASSINPDEARAIANALIYGGEPDSTENLLRYHFASFFCDFQEREEDEYDDDYDDDDDDDDDNDDETPWGIHSGALHLEAVKILINSLQLILDEADNCSRGLIVDFSSQYWASIFDTLVHNVQESSEDLEFARFSVKCIRVLHGLNPTVVEPLIKYSLSPFLFNANGCGCSMLEEEAEQLLEAFASDCTHN